MSDDQKPAPISEAQRIAIVTRMFRSLHTDMGAITKLLTANPTDDGYLMKTEAVGEAVVRLTRGMGALEKLIALNSTTPQLSGAHVAKDGALVAGTWAVEPAPPDDGKPVLTPAAQAEAEQRLRNQQQNNANVVGSIEQMSIGVIQTATANLVVGEKGTEGAAT